MVSQSVTLAELLQKRDYEVFRRSLHALSHQWMGRLLHVKLVCRLALRLIDEDMPLDTLNSHQQALVIPCIDHWNAMHNQVRAYPDRLRCLLWVGGCEDGYYVVSDEGAVQTDIINRERWQPYDERAWDEFFVHVTGLLNPAVTLYDDICAEMEHMLQYVPASTGDPMHNLRAFLVENLHSTREARTLLKRELDPDYIKAMAWD